MHRIGCLPGSSESEPRILGDHSALAPPLPIPNRTVKRRSADDSADLPCESRSSPRPYSQTPQSLTLWGVCLCGARLPCQPTCLGPRPPPQARRHRLAVMAQIPRSSPTSRPITPPRDPAHNTIGSHNNRPTPQSAQTIIGQHNNRPTPHRPVTRPIAKTA
jgi:hypothetical protein